METKELRVQSSRSQTEQRILALLGNGTPANVVASVCGVTESYVSQLLSKEDFKNEVMELKFRNVSALNERDIKYDELEDKIAKQLSDNLCLIQKPQELLRALHVVNNLKRRGSNAGIEGHNGVNNTPVVQLQMPTQVIQQFTMNINNQVIKMNTDAGEQTLETMQSHTLLEKTRASGETPYTGIQNHGNSEIPRLEHGSEREEWSISEIASRFKQRESHSNSPSTKQEILANLAISPGE